jgi:transcriptional regulator GlxA family with amidase domain
LNYSDNESRITVVEKFLLNQLTGASASRLDPIIEKIKKEVGNITIKQLCEDFNISPRQLERSFNEQVGVTAKMFARIIRFANVYKLLQKPDLSKSDATYILGFFDQAHFNKEFKQFTGESPEHYFEGNHHFSNFFLDR